MGLGSGIRKKPTPDPGVKKKDTGSRILDPGSGSATLFFYFRALIFLRRK
jgi:hypothetical protein